jgi:hypothetical protein
MFAPPTTTALGAPSTDNITNPNPVALPRALLALCVKSTSRASSLASPSPSSSAPNLPTNLAEVPSHANLDAVTA